MQRSWNLAVRAGSMDWTCGDAVGCEEERTEKAP